MPSPSVRKHSNYGRDSQCPCPQGAVLPYLPLQQGAVLVGYGERLGVVLQPPQPSAQRGDARAAVAAAALGLLGTHGVKSA